MTRQEERMPDGRRIIYYEFDDEETDGQSPAAEEAGQGGGVSAEEGR